MSQSILYNNGAYNIYCSISDSPVFLEAATLEQLTEYIKYKYGEDGLEALPKRLERAHKNGSSSYEETLNETILSNRAGKNEKRLTCEEFIKKFLIL